jgi:hypothetical protein
MALRSIRGGGTTPQGGADCDFCKERRGRNLQIIHVLKFEDPDDLKRHLAGVFPAPAGTYTQGFLAQLWFTAHEFYGHIARDKQIPLWRAYLDAHGVKPKEGRWEPPPPPEPYRPDPECMKESMRILKRIELPHGHQFHLCGANLVREMLVMDKAFPGRGWGKNARELEADLKRDRARKGGSYP